MFQPKSLKNTLLGTKNSIVASTTLHAFISDKSKATNLAGDEYVVWIIAEQKNELT